MPQAASEEELIAQAVDGDRNALAALLWQHYGKLAGYIKRALPEDLISVTAVEDVIQETHIEVFRTIAKFEARGDAAFYRWLVTIARQRLLDQIKAHRRKKRGGGRKRVRRQPNAAASSVGTLLNVVAAETHTPSRSAARRERERAIAVGLASLKEDYREALRLRYLEGLPVAEIARRMDRTERAVHMLCNRGLKRLREALGNASRYMTR